MDEISSGILDAVGFGASSFLYSLVAVLAGAWLKGYTGFRASMLWMTSLSLVLPPLQVVPMVLMFEVVTSITLLPQIWQDVRWRSIALLLLGTWVAMPIGIHALASLPATPIRIALAIVVFVAAILILRAVQPPNAWFWATHGGGELDLLVFDKGRRIGFEVKFDEAPEVTRAIHEVARVLSLDHLFVVCPRPARLSRGYAH